MFFGMNPEQVVGTIRQFLPFFSGIATALGLTWFDGVASAVLATVGPVGGLISLVWSIVSKKQANILAMAASIPAVEAIKLRPTREGVELERATPDLPQVSTAPIPAGSATLGVGSAFPR